MSSPFQKKEAQISYAERPRLERALLKLSDDQRLELVEAINEHQTSRCMRTVQRRGACLVITTVRGDLETQSTYDFGALGNAQGALTALTDFLRSDRIPVHILPPTNA